MSIFIELVKDSWQLALILALGLVCGWFAAMDSFGGRKKLPFLSYNSRVVQIACRLCLVLGCILCLFVDFPHHNEWRFSFMNVVLFPFIGLVYLAVCWVVTFYFCKLGRRLLDWIFEK